MDNKNSPQGPFSLLSLSAFALLAVSGAALGQDAQIPPVALPYFEQSVADITLDGVPDEAIWQQVAATTQHLA